MIKAVPFYMLVILSIVFLLPACLPGQKHSGFLVVNVLSASLYDDCHIKGSISVPFEELDSFIDTLDTDAQVVFYCSNYMCTSSGYAAKKLREKGFKYVWAYEGGAAEWYQMGLPVEGPCTQAYLQKKIEPSTQKNDIFVISVQGLMRKMGISAD